MEGWLEMDRRRFIRLASRASASTLILSPGSKAKTKAPISPAKIYEAYEPKMAKLAGTKVLPAGVNKALAAHAVDSLARKMGNNKDLGKAWQALLPGIQPTSKIAIKVNALKPQTSPQYCTMEAIILGLKSMFNGTFPAKNIFLIDNDLGGAFKPAHIDNAFGAANLNKLGVWHGKDSYSGDTLTIDGIKLYVSTKLTEAIRSPGGQIINFLCPRPHRIFAGFLSGHIKNMMGTTSTLRNTYKVSGLGAGKLFHWSGERTTTANYTRTEKCFVDLHKYMQPKTALYIADMILMPKQEDGSGYEKIGNRIAFSNDPCAADSYVVDKLLEKGFKVYRGTPPVPYDPTKYTPKALEAAGLGTTSYQTVSVPTGIRKNPLGKADAAANRIYAVSHTPGGVTFRVSSNGRAVKRIRITNSLGQLVGEIDASRVVSNTTIFRWDGRGLSDSRLSSGAYFLSDRGTGAAIGKIALAW